jgi:hypothetical protein
LEHGPEAVFTFIGDLYASSGCGSSEPSAIEKGRGHGGAQGAGEVRAPFRPVKARPGEVSARPSACVDVDAKAPEGLCT